MNIIKNEELISAYKKALEISNLRNIISNKQKINTYINSKESMYLKILDEGSHRAFNRGGYTGVTIEYLAKYVCNTENLKEVAIALVKLLDKKIINSIYCGTIRDIVFESFAMNHAKYKHYVNYCEHDEDNFNEQVDEKLIIHLE